MRKTFEQIVKEHGEWSEKTFPKGTANGALIHAFREAVEVEQEIINEGSKENISIEMADFISCLFDAARRYGKDVLTVARILDYLCDTRVSLNDIRDAFARKLQINKSRTWKDNGDGSYSHIKS